MYIAELKHTPRHQYLARMLVAYAIAIKYEKKTTAKQIEAIDIKIDYKCKIDMNICTQTERTFTVEQHLVGLCRNASTIERCSVCIWNHFYEWIALCWVCCENFKVTLVIDECDKFLSI